MGLASAAVDVAPETRLLRLLCRPEPSDAAIIEVCQTGLDWPGLIREARAHGVAPLCYARFRAVMSAAAPHSTAEALRPDYLRNALRNRVLTDELGRLLEAFRAEGIETIVLKGAALSHLVYPDLVLREMADMDVLIKPADVAAADRLLRHLGYTPASSLPERPAGELSTPGYLSATLYVGPTLIPIHLHWHLLNSTVPLHSYSGMVPMEHLWALARPTTLAGQATHILAPHHFLIHLCEHALRASHSLSRLSHLCDIAWFVHRELDLDWSALITESRAWGLDRFVFVCLGLARSTLQAPVPAWALRSLEPRRLRLGERLLIHRVASGRMSHGLSYLVHLGLYRRLRDKAWFVFRTVAPPQAVLSRHLALPHGSRIGLAAYARRGLTVLGHACRLAASLSRVVAR